MARTAVAMAVGWALGFGGIALANQTELSANDRAGWAMAHALRSGPYRWASVSCDGLKKAAPAVNRAWWTMKLFSFCTLSEEYPPKDGRYYAANEDPQPTGRTMWLICSVHPTGACW